MKESIASALRHTRRQSQTTYDRRTANEKKKGALSLAEEFVRASSSAMESRKDYEAGDESCSFGIGDFVALLEQGSTLREPKVFVGQIQSFHLDKRQVTLLWYKHIRGSEYTFQFEREPWIENIEALLPVTMKAMKKTAGVYKLGRSLISIHKAVNNTS